MAENKKGIVMPGTLRLDFEDYCIDCDVPKLQLDNLAVDNGFCNWHNHYTLYCENHESCEKMHRKLESYESYFKQVSSLNDCNNCKKRDCEYRPKLGENVRINCPLWKGENL